MLLNEDVLLDTHVGHGALGDASGLLEGSSAE